MDYRKQCKTAYRLHGDRLLEIIRRVGQTTVPLDSLAGKALTYARDLGQVRQSAYDPATDNATFVLVEPVEEQ